MNQIPILAGVCLFYKRKMLLLKLVKNSQDNGRWGPPSGHGEKGETLLKTALRETKEETNLDIKVSGLVQSGKLTVSGGKEFLIAVYFSEISDISNLKIDPNESSEYAWVNCEEIESGKYPIRSESFLKPILIKAFKDKPLPLDSFVNYKYEGSD